MHLESFQKILGTTNNFRNRRNFFSSYSKYYFLQSVRYIQRNLNFELISIYFLKKQLVSVPDKSQVQKSVNVITYFFCTVKKQKFRSVHSWNPCPSSFQCYLSLNVWCVCFVLSISIICVSQEGFSLI